MKNSPLFPPRIFLLAGTMLTLAVSGCSSSMYEDLREAIQGRREPQVVNGPLRVPELNAKAPASAPVPPPPPMMTPPPPPAMMMAPPPPAAFAPPPPPMDAPAPREAAPSDNPYDRYDDEGRPVAPKAMAEPPEKEGFFDRLFKPSQAAPEKAPVPAPVPVPVSGEPRKPIPGNPYYSGETSAVAPLPPAPESVAPVEPQQAALPEIQPEPSVAAPLEIASEAPPLAEVTPEEKPSWFARTFGDLKSPFSNDAEASAPAASEPYPRLSSVPETPARFSDVKAEKDQRLEELQSDHMQAQSDKLALDAEPSEAVIAEPAKPAPAVNVQPAPVKPVAKPAAKPVAKSSPAGGPVLLGHVSDTAIVPPAAAAPVVQAEDVRKDPPAPVVQMEEEPAPSAAAASAEAAPVPLVGEDAPENAAAAPAAGGPEIKILPPSRYSQRGQHLPDEQ